jgi:hypothetical protein
MRRWCYVALVLVRGVGASARHWCCATLLLQRWRYGAAATTMALWRCYAAATLRLKFFYFLFLLNSFKTKKESEKEKKE